MSNLILHETTLRNLPEQDFNRFLFNFGNFLDKILNLEGEKSAKRLETLLPMVKDAALGFTEKELTDAMTMYVKGQLGLEPLDNYLTVIQFHKILNAYRDLKKRQPKTEIQEIKMSENEKKEILRQGAIRLFEHYKKHKRFDGVFVHIYDYLFELGLLPKDKEYKMQIWEKAQIVAVYEAKTQSGLDGMELRSKLKQIQAGADNDNIIVISKRMVLKEYFDKLILENKTLKI